MATPRLLLSLLLAIVAPAAASAQCGTTVQGSVSGTWTLAGSPYCVIGDLTVVDVTIEAGVQVLTGPDATITVTGRLRARGSAAAPVSFDGAGTSGWGGLEFRGGVGSTLDHCRIQSARDSGVRIVDAAPALTRCEIRGNAAAEGGGLWISIAAGDLALTECVIEDNTAINGGGGIQARLPGGRLILDRCTLRRNRVEVTSTGDTNVEGGGLSCPIAAEVLLVDCLFEANQASATSTGFLTNAVATGGGLRVASPALTLRRCVLRDNLCVATVACPGCEYDSALACGGGVYFVAAEGVFAADNCVLAGNAVSATADFSDARGGAIGTLANGVFLLRNSTIARNRATQRGNPGAVPVVAGLYLDRASLVATVTRSIVYGNVNDPRLGSPTPVPQIAGNAAMTVTYSDVERGFLGRGNIGDDPGFAGPGTTCGAVEITRSSPAVDAGDPDSRFDDSSFPPSLGSLRNDMGSGGGPLAAGWSNWARAQPDLALTPLRSCPVPPAALRFSIAGGAMTMPAGVFLEAIAGVPLSGGPVWLPVPVRLCTAGSAEFELAVPQSVCTVGSLTFRAYALDQAGGLTRSTAVVW